MPRQKDPKLQDKIRQWVENNPDRWYTARYEDIQVETGVSVSTLYRYFPLIVARIGKIRLSTVKAKREAHFGVSPWQQRLSDEEIAEIQRLYDEEHSSPEIAFMTGRSLSQVQKYRPKKPSRREAGGPMLQTQEPTEQNKLRRWVEKHPDRWYTAIYKDIHIETGVSLHTVYRYYPLIVARAAGILPSKVKAKRKEHLGDYWPWELSEKEIARIQQLDDEGHDILDISFMTGHSLAMVAKYRNKDKDQEASPKSG